MKKFLVVSVLAIMMLNASCVSKKKFLALQDTYHHTTDSLVDVTDNLNDKLILGEKDFESTKQDLMISDASKNDQISNLEIQLKELQGSFNELTNSLEYSEERIAETQQAKDQASYQLVRMNQALSALRQDTVSLNYAIKLQRKKADKLQEELTAYKEKYQADKELQKAEVLSLKKETEKVRLKQKEMERQLAIKQKQMDGVSAAFVELRKEMLRSKTQGVAVDPNNNASIDKIAKALGQY